jgi:hypothetical protein
MSTPETVQPKFIDSDSRFLIYCNMTEMSVSPWDVRIKLMESFDNEGNVPIVKRHGVMLMSPVHAKAMLEALEQTVRVYEEKFGEIDLAKVKNVIKTASPSLP